VYIYNIYLPLPTHTVVRKLTNGFQDNISFRHMTFSFIYNVISRYLAHLKYTGR